MQTPGVAVSRTCRALIWLVGAGRLYCDGVNHSAVPGAGKPFAVGGAPATGTSGWVGDDPPPADGAGCGDIEPAGWFGGRVQCAAPQAESAKVSVVETTWNGSAGSRFCSTGGAKLASGATGSGGLVNAGRSLGAIAATSSSGGATETGGVFGSPNPSGRVSGAYSGPSCHVAMATIVVCPPAGTARLKRRLESGTSEDLTCLLAG